MKKLKYLLPIILSLTVIVTIFVVSQIPAKAETVSGTCGANGDNLTWELDNETWTLTISGSGRMYDYHYFDDIPWDDYKNIIKAVNITDGVTSIGDDAFSRCDSLTSVTIPDSVTSVGDGAFNDCRSLISVTIPDSVTSIGDDAFNGCKDLTSITIPDGVTSIGEYAFAFCSSLTSVTIPDSVTSIGEDAFLGCSNLMKAYISSKNIVENLTSRSSCSHLIYYATAILIDNTITNIPSYVTTNYPYTSTVVEDSVTYTRYSVNKIVDLPWDDDGNITTDTGSDTPDSGEQESGETNKSDKSDTPDTQNGDKKSNTTLIIISVVAAIAVLGCCAMAVILITVLKKRK